MASRNKTKQHSSKWKNYITPRGYRRLRGEQQRLRFEERPRIVDEVAHAASLGDRSENAEYIYGKKRLRQIDGRLRFLDRRIEAAEVVDPAIDRGLKVYFGATLVLGYPGGEERRYQLVGEDEIEADKGRISWRSPIGRALLGREEGDTARFKHLDRWLEVEILEVEYRVQDPNEPFEGLGGAGR